MSQDKWAVKAINSLKQWQKSLKVLEEDLSAYRSRKTGELQVNGDEVIADKLRELNDVIEQRVEDIRLKGYVPKNKQI